MGVRTAQVLKDDVLGHKLLVVPIPTAVGQADVLAYSFVPGHPFEIVGVEAYARVEAGVVSADVKIQAVSALAAIINYVTATRVVGALSALFASRRGSQTDAINVHYTSDGAGVLTNGVVTVRYRAMPMNGDAGTE